MLLGELPDLELPRTCWWVLCISWRRRACRSVAVVDDGQLQTAGEGKQKRKPLAGFGPNEKFPVGWQPLLSLTRRTRSAGWGCG